MSSGAGPSRQRDKGRSHTSGAQKRKKKKEENEMIQKLPKITAFVSRKNALPAAEKPYCHASSNEPLHDESNSNTGTEDEESPLEETFSGDPVLEGVPTTADNTLEMDEHIIDYTSDIGMWPKDITETFRAHWLQKGSQSCRNENSDFKQSAIPDLQRGGFRHCTSSLFTRAHSLTDDSYDMTWLCYSKSQGKLYCFMCKLLGKDDNAFTRGFQDWKNATALISAHSRSSGHRMSLGNAVIRSKNSKVDQHLIEAQLAETRYWRKVLTRVVDVLSFLCERGLSIRGKDERIGSVHNGNFLGIIELIARSDSFLAEHLEKHANKGSGSTSYLSHSICDELLKIMAKRVTDIIVAEIQEAKYFSISTDSTPDITHVDQLSVTAR